MNLVHSAYQKHHAGEQRMNESGNITAKATLPITDEAFAAIDHTAVYWLGGAGFLLNVRGTILLIDPVLLTLEDDDTVSEFGLKLKISYPIRPDAIPRLDAVLYTHSDADHLGPRTALALSTIAPRFYGTLKVFERLVRLGIPHEQIDVCRSGDEFSASGIVVEPTPADHPWQLQDPPRGGKPFRPEDCCGFILNTPDGRLFFPGDTRLMEEHLKIRDIHLLALDVSVCAYHLGHVSAALLANTLSEALLVPLHYGTYHAPGKGAHMGDPADVFAKVEGAEQRARILAPGEPLRIKHTKQYTP